MVTEVLQIDLPSIFFRPPMLLPRFDRSILLSSVFFDPRFPAIGPHEYREADLLERGWKPMALFSDVVGLPPSPEECAVARLIDTGRYASYTFHFPECHGSSFPYTIRHTVYFPKKQCDDCNTIQTSLSWRALVGDSPATNVELTVGRALGYCDRDIVAFILNFARHA
jgi:hypothetical protein